MKKVLSLFLSLLMCSLTMVMGLTATAAGGKTIYVSPDGSDDADGSIDAPLRSIEGAKKKARDFNGNVTVYLRGGFYTVDNTVTFSSKDKGYISFESYPGEKAVITAGTPYTGFEECTVNGVRAFKKNVGASAAFNTLFNEETTLPRTRYPEKGFFTVADAKNSDILNPDTPEAVHSAFAAMYSYKKDLLDFKNAQDVVIRILHFWKDEMLTIKSLDMSTGRVEFSRPTSMQIRNIDRYFFENVFEALNDPGEWYLDKAEGVLYYIPLEGETADTLTLWGSETETMINVDGADGISFKNIAFRGNGFNIPRNNTERDLSSQAAYDATPCVSYSNAHNFEITNCEFTDIAACAVFFGVNVRKADVKNCLFHNIGAQAVYIKGDNVSLEDKTVTKGIDIINNSVSSYGRVFFNAVGILVINANTVNVSNNEIHDGYYTAISVGWVWGYGYTVTSNNRICDNLIYNIGQGWLSDMGGIYTLGNQPGTVLSGNVIHNVAADPGLGGYGGWGIYLDEGSSYILVEKNLVYACGSDSYHLHYGSYNTVRNNIFALSNESQLRVCSAPQRVTPEDAGHKTADFENNIVLTDGKSRVMSYLMSKDTYSENGNLFWDLTNRDEVYFSIGSNAKNSMSFETAVRRGWANKTDIVADPMFKNAAQFDFELSDDSPAIKAGFEKFDYSLAGTVAGTVIGLDTPGGQSKYNDSSVGQLYTPAKEPFHFLLLIWYKLLKFLGL